MFEGQAYHRRTVTFGASYGAAVLPAHEVEVTSTLLSQSSDPALSARATIAALCRRQDLCMIQALSKA